MGRHKKNEALVWPRALQRSENVLGPPLGVPMNKKKWGTRNDMHEEDPIRQNPIEPRTHHMNVVDAMSLTDTAASPRQNTGKVTSTIPARKDLDGNSQSTLTELSTEVGKLTENGVQSSSGDK